MTDIGVGDLVEAVRQCMNVNGEIVAPAGTRAVVLEVVIRNHFARMTACGYCKESVPSGLIVSMVPSPPGRCWCTCVWRKVGGPPEAESRFAEDLNRELDRATVRA